MTTYHNDLSLPGYDSWKLAEPPRREDDIPADHLVTLEVIFRASLTPDDAGTVAQEIADKVHKYVKELARSYPIVVGEDGFKKESPRVTLLDLWELD